MQFQVAQEPIRLGRDEWSLLIREPATIPIFDILERLDNNEDSVPRMPHSLKLRTKIYKVVNEKDPLPPPAKAEDGSSNDSTKNESTSDIEAPEVDSTDDHPDEPSCTICYLGIEDGDRIGALECDHIFHVDCLKVWLARRNVCPLCLTENAATPQYNNDDSPESPSDQNDTEGSSEAE
jgi:Ring finger domain